MHSHIKYEIHMNDCDNNSNTCVAWAAVCRTVDLCVSLTQLLIRLAHIWAKTRNQITFRSFRTSDTA